MDTMTMTPAEFLSAVWPASGIYVLATPYTPPGLDKSVYAHRTFHSIPMAAAFIEQRKNVNDFYFGVHSLREERVFNPKKINIKTGELGAYEVRVQSNSLAARCFFFDLDIGPSKTHQQKYVSQAEGLHALREFCKATQLPKPMVVSSGSGLHVYWLLETELTSDEWRPHAAKLKALAAAHKLWADPARTTDSASVLRVVGTLNYKDRQNPRPVQLLMKGARTDTDTFLGLLSDAVIRQGVATTAPLPPKPAADPVWGESNLSTAPVGPPVPIRAVLTACELMQEMVRSKGSTSEPAWYHTLNLVRYLENGDRLVHKISEGHPNYDPGETSQKVAQLEAKGVAPTSCLKLAEVTGSDACTRCPFQGKVKSPIVAARYRDPAPAPVAIPAVGALPPVQIPDAPKPYVRLKDGRIIVRTTDSEGNEIDQQIHPYDLYPIMRVANTEGNKETQEWRAHLPVIGAKDFALPSEALYDRQKFVTTLANCGVYPDPSNLSQLQAYMVAYIQELQRQQAAATQHDHLGWIGEFEGFILPEKTYMADGTVKPSVLGGNALAVKSDMSRKGTLQRQVELLKFFDNPGYAAHQFLILGSLAAPIFWCTGHHGMIINASGKPGAGKSTALYTGASFWGEPEKFTLNATSLGATAKYKDSRMTTMSNLPLCADEITMMEPKTAKDMALAISQNSGRRGLDSHRNERKGPDNHKATIMLSTANSSLHSMLSHENASGTAGSMRVFEIITSAPGIHTKAQADDYWHELRRNYGWIGEAFIAWVAKNTAVVEARVRDKVREIDVQMHTDSSERFWSAAIAAVVVAGEIAQELGLLSFNTRYLQTWAIEQQITRLRGVIHDEYSTPAATLQEYLAMIHGDTLITTSGDKFNSSQDFVVNATRPRQLLAHYDKTAQVIWVLRKGFKDYCARQGGNFVRILEDLNAPTPGSSGKVRRLVKDKMVKRTLGAFTEYAKGQAWCFSIDMTHPEMVGVEKALDSNVIQIAT